MRVGDVGGKEVVEVPNGRFRANDAPTAGSGTPKRSPKKLEGC